MRNLTINADGIQNILNRYREWLFHDADSTFYLLSSEIRVETLAEKLRIIFPSDKGVRSIDFRTLKIENSRLIINPANPDQAVAPRVEFVPRLLASELRESTEKARLEAVNEIAARFSRQFAKLKPVRVALNEQNGRFAEIIARFGVKRIAILADVSGAVQREALLSKAFVWLWILNARKRREVSEIWIVAESKEAVALGALVGCLKGSKSTRIVVWQPGSLASNESDRLCFERLGARTFNSLWSGRLPRLSLLEKKPPTKFASRLLESGADTIDLVNTAKGETIRFFGLPFARTRTIAEQVQVWFGREREKTILDETTAPEFTGLIESLSRNRCFDAPNKQHEFYRSAPEAWLESILRRNIKRLDANLILSPIYNQFRAAREKIDLLALRIDGRLVIIELKIAPDRDMVFQAIDYWRRVESQRRRGNLDELELFGEKAIADRPTVIYLVAPTLGFHPDLENFARLVRNEIEIFRFDLAENWREEIKVLRRRRMGR